MIRKKSLQTLLEEAVAEATVTKVTADTIIETMADTLVIVNPEGNIERVNQATLNLLGYKQHELIGKPVNKIIAGTEAGAADKMFRGAWMERLMKEGFIGVELPYLTKDKKEIPMGFSATAMKDEKGELICIVCVAKDLSERRDLAKIKELFNTMTKAYHELKSAQARLIQSEKMAAIGSISAGIAHELNNPLMGAVVLLEVLQSEADKNSKIYTTLETVIPELKRCTEIVTNLLTIAQPDARVEEKFSQADIPKLIDKTLNLVASQFMKMKINIIKDYSPNLPRIWCRPKQIQQVILNLLTNARDSMERTEVKELAIKVWLDNDMARIEFIDTGCGIPKEDLPKLFHPFFTTKGPGKGTGLGLSVSQSIIESHGGQIEIKSKEGKGTKATILLPVGKVKE